MDQILVAKLAEIIDNELYKAYLRGDDLKQEIVNGSILGSVYWWVQNCKSTLCDINFYPYFCGIVDERYRIVLKRIRAEKISKFIA